MKKGPWPTNEGNSADFVLPPAGLVQHWPQFEQANFETMESDGALNL
jgi:hypothetical protein